MDTTYPGWTSVRPENDAERFTDRSNERQSLFEKVKSLYESSEINPVLWAFLQIADIDQVKDATRSNYSWDSTAYLANPAMDAIRLWKQKPEAKNGTLSGITSLKQSSSHAMPSSPLPPSAAATEEWRTRSKRKRGVQESSLGRSKIVAARCKERDNNLCAVSRMAAIDAAHIYPWCAFGDKGTERVKGFWSILRMFWKQEVVDNWHKVLFVDPNTPYRGTENVSNMISFTSTLHRFHSNGAFALRPIQISDDKTKLELEFHWLEIEERELGTGINLLDRPQSSQARTRSGKGYGPFIRYDTGDNGDFTPLESGTRFTMSTDDPENMPLPDPGLMALQWHLQRVLAMSGAAGWSDDDFDNDDDDDFDNDDDDDDDAGGLSARDIESWADEVPRPTSDHQHRPSPPNSGPESSEDGSSE